MLIILSLGYVGTLRQPSRAVFRCVCPQFGLLFYGRAEHLIQYILKHGASQVQRRKPLIEKDLLYFSGKQKNMKVFHIGTQKGASMDTAPCLKIFFSPPFTGKTGYLECPARAGLLIADEGHHASTGAYFNEHLFIFNSQAVWHGGVDFGNALDWRGPGAWRRGAAVSGHAHAASAR